MKEYKIVTNSTYFRIKKRTVFNIKCIKIPLLWSWVEDYGGPSDFGSKELALREIAIIKYKEKIHGGPWVETTIVEGS